MTNYYPELPELEYQRTTVAMMDVIAHIKAASVNAEIQRSAYIIFRIESGNGTSGINNNYCGMQADSGTWPADLNHFFAGTVTEPENGTGRTRIFLAFEKWQDCVDCLIDRVSARGLFISGMAIPISHMLVATEADLCTAYVREWAQGSKTARPTVQEFTDWRSMYGQAMGLFRHGAVAPQPVPHQMPANTDSADALNAAELTQIEDNA